MAPLESKRGTGTSGLAATHLPDWSDAAYENVTSLQTKAVKSAQRSGFLMVGNKAYDQSSSQPWKVPEVSVTDKDYIDARTDLVRAQNDARFAEVAGKIDTLAGKIDGLSGRLDGVVTRLDGLPTRRDAWLAPASAAAGLFLAGLAVLAFAGDRFDSGFGLAEKQQEQLERDRQQDEVIKRMDAILTRLDAQSASPATPAAPSGATSGN